ncbi:MAG: ROK family protein [Chloroflexi bacterium]|nr:ROK family protein [Chloroflexota bacterium]
MANQYYIGVDLGGTSLLAAVVDAESGRVIGESKRKTRSELGADGVTTRLVETIERAIKESRVKRDDIVGIGIGVPGPIDPTTGVVVRCENLGPSWDQYELGRTLDTMLHLPVTLDNDVNVGALGEHAFGAGKGYSDMVAIFVGTGVGGGVIIDNHLYSGSRNSAGEVGHLIVQAEGGPRCNCGQNGCAEALCSRLAIERYILEAIAAGESSIVPDILVQAGREDVSANIIGTAYEAGDQVTIAAVNKAQFYLGILVASCVNLLDPQAVVVGGGVLERMGDAYLEPVREAAYQRFINHAAAEEVKIVRAGLGDHSGVVGAAILARDRLS